MAFPTTGVLDTFNRANGDPGPNWTSPAWLGLHKFQILSNQVQFTTIGDEGDGYWNPATFGPDAEAYTLIPTISFGGSLLIRLGSPGASVNGYRLQFGASFQILYRLDGGVVTQLGATITATVSDGDSIGIDSVGSTLTAYRKNAGAWATLETRPDATYSAAGYVGMTSSQDFVRVDDFGGGTVVAAAGQIGTFRTDRIRSRRTSW